MLSAFTKNLLTSLHKMPLCLHGNCVIILFPRNWNRSNQNWKPSFSRTYQLCQSPETLVQLHSSLCPGDHHHHDHNYDRHYHMTSSSFWSSPINLAQMTWSWSSLSHYIIIIISLHSCPGNTRWSFVAPLLSALIPETQHSAIVIISTTQRAQIFSYLINQSLS